MLGTISIADLEVCCIVGILAHEREREQLIFLDIELDRDFTDAARTEDIEHTVNYAELSELLDAWIREQKFRLIETMAERSCALLFERWPEIQRIKLTVKKPNAIAAARHTAVSVERTRSTR
jgi:dihydroneopterin aldolase